MCFHGPILICCADHRKFGSCHTHTLPALQQLHIVLNIILFASLHDRLLYTDICLAFVAEAEVPVVREADEMGCRKSQICIAEGSARLSHGN